jgi:hypothetical protein
MKTDLIHDQTSEHSQGYDRTRIVRTARGTLRTTIHLDTSYRYQSRALIEVWLPLAGWAEVHAAPGEALPWPTGFTPAVIRAMLDEIVARFEAIAAAVLA